MRHLPPLVATIIIQLLPPLFLGSVVTSSALLFSQTPAQAQSAEAVAKIAQAITVRIEGATQGSGVLVKKDANRYTILTAWHVVKAQRPGEELAVFTPDGKQNQLESGSIKRIGNVDLAVFTFISPESYDVATLGNDRSTQIGAEVYVAGYPLPTTAVPARIFRFLKGDVIANTLINLPNGYRLLYSNPTLPGMSGGAVLNAEGQLVGIHGQGETDSVMSELQGVAVKTGTNQAVSISYYEQWLPSRKQSLVIMPTPPASSVGQGLPMPGTSWIGMTQSTDKGTRQNLLLEDRKKYLSRAESLLGIRGQEQEVIRLSSLILDHEANAKALYLRGYARDDLDRSELALADLSESIRLDPSNWLAYRARGFVNHRLRNYQAASSDYKRALSMQPGDSITLANLEQLYRVWRPNPSVMPAYP